MCGIAGLWQLSSSQEDSLEKARRLQGLLKSVGPMAKDYLLKVMVAYL